MPVLGRWAVIGPLFDRYWCYSAVIKGSYWAIIAFIGALLGCYFGVIGSLLALLYYRAIILPWALFIGVIGVLLALFARYWDVIGPLLPLFGRYWCYWAVIGVINPRRACAARVTVVVP